MLIEFVARHAMFSIFFGSTKFVLRTPIAQFLKIVCFLPN